MKQRLALARALLIKPRLLYLDEPTSGLDPEAAKQVHDLIRDVRKTDGHTVVLCTHHLYEAEQFATAWRSWAADGCWPLVLCHSCGLKRLPNGKSDFHFWHPSIDANSSVQLKSQAGVVMVEQVGDDSLLVEVEDKSGHSDPD